MEEVFNKLQQQGKNTVENIIKWMKDAKILPDKAAEDKAKEIMGRSNEDKVELEKFKEALEKTAADQNKSVADYNRMLVEQQGQGALQSGAKALGGLLK